MGIMELFGERVDSQGQLEAAKRVSARNAEMDAEARRQGFNNGDEMMQWMRQRQMKREPQTIAKGSTTSGPISDAMSLHPKYLLEYVTRRMKEARGQDAD